MLGLKSLFGWVEWRAEKAQEQQHDEPKAKRPSGQSGWSNDGWLRESVIESLKGGVWLADHCLWPKPESNEIPRTESYDIEELLKPIPDYQLNEPLQPRQQAAIYEFMSDYLLFDNTDSATEEEWTDWIDTAYVQLDNYFFKGGLTQDNRRLVKLFVHDRSQYGLWSYYRLGAKGGMYRTGRLVVFLVSGITGKRLDKLSILNSLVHEMIHAYLDIFYHYCREDRGRWGEIEDDSGHGSLWVDIFTRICAHMRDWHPSLANLPPARKYSTPREFSNPYFSWMERLFPSSIREEWEVNNVPEHSCLLPEGATIRPERLRDFKRALVRLQFPTYEAFVRAKAPPSETAYTVYRIAKKGLELFMIIFVFLAGYQAGRFISQTLLPFFSQTVLPLISRTVLPFFSQTIVPFFSQTVTSFFFQTVPSFFSQTFIPFFSQIVLPFLSFWSDVLTSEKPVNSMGIQAVEKRIISIETVRIPS
ncbi:hypothetical protein O1611_g5040 [Lasiodiplodia mahajangana]|uniref:Uncharacterized protein n=1 Tax=Lasiodiplodia mahajangana TaxID=1108764 RepID=A0ACC2JMA9_9PEZI|nr:hypothetical protein O1611_g5040 [Lasiodiplodia mahajangana]